MNDKKLSLIIVGGCFPVQDNIPAEKLYHFQLTKEIRRQFDSSLDVSIVRYERFSDCMNKITSIKKEKPAQILLFHFRSEHFLRLCKFYYRYRNEQQIIMHSCNLLLCNMTKAEKYDLLSQVLPGTHTHNPLQKKNSP